MTYYTGIDVSLRSVSICILDDKGEVRHEAKLAAEIDPIVNCLRGFSEEVKLVGLEAGTASQYLTYGLQAAGFEVLCLEVRQVSAAHRLVQPGACEEPTEPSGAGAALQPQGGPDEMRGSGK